MREWKAEHYHDERGWCVAEYNDAGFFSHLVARYGTEEFTRRLAKLPGLEAIVDKLPKCWRLDEAGKLRHDVPLIIHERPKVIVFAEPYPNATSHDWCWLTIRSYDNGYLSGVIHGVSRTGFFLSECYNTLKAAQAAGEEVGS